jgi:hypothetical protein
MQTNIDDAFDERGLLKDGHVARVRMTLKDGAHPRLHDGRGGQVGCRPGFLVSDVGHEAKAEALWEYENWLTNRWRDQRPRDQQEGQSCTTSGGDPGTLQWRDGDLVCVADDDEPDAASDSVKDHKQKMAQLYSNYDRELANAWRRR